MAKKKDTDTMEFDFEAAKKGRDEGIQRAHDGAEEGWRGLALQVVLDICKTGREFLVDDVWRALDARGVPRPKEGRAMAGVLRAAESQGWCRKLNQYRASAQKQCHCNPRMIRIGTLCSHSAKEGA